MFRIRCEKVVVGGEECADGFSLFVEAIKAYEKASTITYAAADAANAAASSANEAADLVVLFKDAATRTVDAFHAKYDFASNFSTTTTVDPRPDLTAEGVVYQ